MIRRIFAALALTCCMFAQSSASMSSLRLGAGDLIDVEVFDVPELKQELRISDAGNADLLTLGTVHLAGLTLPDAEDFIAKQLRERLLVTHPQVTLFVREYATQGAAISGEIRKPGIYAMFGPRTLLQLIAEAGGPTEIAAPKISVRHRDGKEETALLKNAAQFNLRPGDAVIIPRTGIAYIVGEIQGSGGYAMQDEGTLSVAQLVSLGGGLRPTARGSKAKLVRGSGKNRRELAVDIDRILRGRAPDLAIQADDILFIPDSLWKTVATRLQNITQMAAGAAIYTSLN